CLCGPSRRRPLDQFRAVHGRSGAFGSFVRILGRQPAALMKIAVVTRYLHHVGGVETYLTAVLPSLVAHGNDLSVWHEFKAAANTAQIVAPHVPSRCIGGDQEGALNDLKRAAPDVIFLHGLSDPALEHQLTAIAPLLVLLHAYHGTCVSEAKLHRYPRPQICDRPLGPGCLLRYFPRRCGGWNRVTMFASYGKERRRQTLLREWGLIATLSAHMREECIAQGVDPARVIHLPAFASSEKRLPKPEEPGATRSRTEPPHL